MEKLLYVTANPKGIEKSKGLKIGEAFLESFQQERPDVEIKKIDLFSLEFPQMDADLVSARGKLAGYGYTLDQLSEIEREKYLKCMLSLMSLSVMITFSLFLQCGI